MMPPALPGRTGLPPSSGSPCSGGIPALALQNSPAPCMDDFSSSRALQVLATAVMVEQRAGALAAVCWHPQRPCLPWGGGRDWHSPRAEMLKAPELVGVGRTHER